MINLKLLNKYNKKYSLILFGILCISYTIEILIQFYNLNSILNSLNNLNTNKLIISKIIVVLVYVLFKFVSFIIIFSMYYFILSRFLKNFFDDNHKLLKKEFIQISTIATIFKVLLMNCIILIIVFAFKYNNIDIFKHIVLFTNITFILNVIFNIISIFIIYKLFDIKAKKQNYKKIPIHNFFIPYLIILTINITIKYIV